MLNTRQVVVKATRLRRFMDDLLGLCMMMMMMMITEVDVLDELSCCLSKAIQLFYLSSS